MQVVDAPAWYATQRHKGSRMGVKEHFVALAGVGHQPEGAAGTQLEVGHLQLVEDPPDHHAFIAPVELERFAQLEGQRHKGLGCLAFMITPGADEIGDATVATRITIGFDLNKLIWPLKNGRHEVCYF
jgi:hypothetical protein